MRVVPMTAHYDKQIAGWRYEGDYAFYDRREDAGQVDDEQYGEHYAVVDEDGALVGFFRFGESTRIPTVEAHVYDSEATDIGLGMRPDKCGKGGGYAFVKTGLVFAGKKYGATAFRLSVAAFNMRAVKAYEKAGFEIMQTVTNSYFRNKFYIMILTKAGGDES